MIRTKEWYLHRVPFMTPAGKLIMVARWRYCG